MDNKRPKKPCDHCGRGIGMVSYNWWRRRFCSRAHKELFKRKWKEDFEDKQLRLEFNFRPP